MTWLSRLLPQSPRLPRLADHNNRSRQAQRRRRMATLESLEGRTLLNGTVTVGPAVAGVVTITGDGHNNNLNINEHGGSTITVSGIGTSINGLPLGTSVKVFQVTSIVVKLPPLSPSSGAALATVSITETPKVTSGISNISISAVGPTALSTGVGLNLTVTGVVDSGNFSVVSTGALNANVTGSQFSTLSISQTGCCLASVELDGDTVVGAVTVSEGLENYDYIGLNTTGTAINHFGSTTLKQGVGPETTPGNLGDFDQVVVNDSNLKDLTITQPTGTGTALDKHGKTYTDENGDGDSIIVGLGSEVEVNLLSFGIYASQGDGEGDLIEIVSITTTIPAHPPNIPPIPAAIDGIVTIQGNGGPATKTGTLGDQTLIENVRVYGNISVTQGNGNYDNVQLQDDTAGIVVSPVGSPVVVDLFGTASISQGDGYNDTVTLDSFGVEGTGYNNLNNVSISQGDSLVPPPGTPCVPGLGDVASVNESNITSDLAIYQGVNGSSIGNNTVNIATEPGETVYAGGNTIIDEESALSANNYINLGGANPANTATTSGVPDFETFNLDVYTGANGGAVVTVLNTLVDNGLLGLYGAYNIEGGGTDNLATIDAYSSATVDADTAFFVVTFI